MLFRLKTKCPIRSYGFKYLQKRTDVTQTKNNMLRVHVNLVKARILICVSEVSVTCFNQTEEVWHVFVISVIGGKMFWSIKIKMQRLESY